MAASADAVKQGGICRAADLIQLDQISSDLVKTPLFNFPAVSESTEPISELYGLNCGSKVSPKNGQKSCANKSTLNSTAVSESIEPISGFYG